MQLDRKKGFSAAAASSDVHFLNAVIPQWNKLDASPVESE